MPTARISKRSVDAMVEPPAGSRTWLWDDQVRGFGTAMSSSGRKSYFLQYRMGGRETPARRYRIGTHGSPWTPDSARERAIELLRQVEAGIDPGRVLGEDANGTDTQSTLDAQRFGFAAFVDRFMERHVVAGELRSRKDIEGTFRRDLTPRFGERDVRAVTKQEVKDALSDIGLRSRSAANKAHKWLNRLYSWGLKQDRLDSSPMLGLTKPFAERKRDRVLADDEVRLLVGILDGVSWQSAALILLLLLTGQRLREVAGMRWAEVDLAQRQWIIPGTRTKNRRPHLVPLSTQVAALLTSIRNGTDGTEHVLTTNGRAPISGFSKIKAAIDKLTHAAGGLEPWVLHDLRRTFATGCAALRIPIEHSEAALNHVSGTRGGVAGIYHLYAYAPEKKIAMQRWANHVEKVVGARRLRLSVAR